MILRTILTFLLPFLLFSFTPLPKKSVKDLKPPLEFEWGMNRAEVRTHLELLSDVRIIDSTKGPGGGSFTFTGPRHLGYKTMEWNVTFADTTGWLWVEILYDADPYGKIVRWWLRLRDKLVSSYGSGWKGTQASTVREILKTTSEHDLLELIQEDSDIELLTAWSHESDSKYFRLTCTLGISGYLEIRYADMKRVQIMNENSHQKE